MSWILGVDTSSSNLSLGLVQDGKPVLSFTRFVKNSHSEHIATVIEHFFTLAGISPKEISHAVVVTGPGSFTGLRIGISFLKGLFASGETKVLSLSSLENMAAAYPQTVQTVHTVIDARQDFVFTGSFSYSDNLVVRNTDDEKKSLDSLLSSLDDNDLILFDTAGNIRSIIPETLKSYNCISFPELNLPTGLSAALRGSNLIDNEELWEEAINVFPNYMQESYAERVKK